MAQHPALYIILNMTMENMRDGTRIPITHIIRIAQIQGNQRGTIKNNFLKLKTNS
jgi:hypothetical protein